MLLTFHLGLTGPLVRAIVIKKGKSLGNKIDKFEINKEYKTLDRL